LHERAKTTDQTTNDCKIKAARRGVESAVVSLCLHLRQLGTVRSPGSAGQITEAIGINVPNGTNCTVANWSVSSSLNFPENHRFDFAIAAVAGTGRLNAPRWATERASVGRLISSIKTGQGIGLSDDASSQGRTPWLMEIAVNASAV
jgi:hypothetical protein